MRLVAPLRPRDSTCPAAAQENWQSTGTRVGSTCAGVECIICPLERTPMRRLLTLLPLLLVTGMLAVGQPVRAQTKSLYWEGWDTTLTILPNGDLHVVERQRINCTDGTFTF